MWHKIFNKNVAGYVGLWIAIYAVLSVPMILIGGGQ